MPFESLIVNNRIAQFAARFEAQPDGGVVYYHPSGHYGGLPCTLAEAEQLIQHYAVAQGRSMRWMLLWAICAGLILGVLDASGLWHSTQLEQIAIILAPMPLLFQSWYRASRSPLNLMRERRQVAPPRSRIHAFWVRAHALPPGLFLALWAINGLLIYYYFRDHTPVTAGTAFSVLSACLLTVLKLVAAFRMRRYSAGCLAESEKTAATQQPQRTHTLLDK
jgi:hypothetical protein